MNEGTQSHDEKPDVNKILEISEERDNENTLLTTSNCGSDHQPHLSKQKQFISPDAAFATNPSFEHFVENIVSEIVVECGKKFYFNDKSKYKVSTADVTPTNILKLLCPNPTQNKYANIRSNNSQTLLQKQLYQSVSLQQLPQFGISSQTANALGKCTFPNSNRRKI